MRLWYDHNKSFTYLLTSYFTGYFNQLLYFSKSFAWFIQVKKEGHEIAWSAAWMGDIQEYVEGLDKGQIYNPSLSRKNMRF